MEERGGDTGEGGASIKEIKCYYRLRECFFLLKWTGEMLKSF